MIEKTEQSNNNTLKNNIINSDLSNTDLWIWYYIWT